MNALLKGVDRAASAGRASSPDAGSAAPGMAYMQDLRRDHAGLSRVLREIDTQAARLTEAPADAGPLLAEAMRYLLRYHHAFHHPREDRLFARIRARDSGLETTLADLSDEHEVGEAQAEVLARDLEAATLKQLRGRVGRRLAGRVNEYVCHTRAHMRHEEAVFYARAEAALHVQDWLEIIASDHGPKDPLADLAEMGKRYPRLAASLGLPVTHLVLRERVEPLSEELEQQWLALTDLYGALLHDAVDLGRGNLNRLLAVRSPRSLAGAVGEITRANLDFAGRCVFGPPRWAVNSGAALIAASLKPYLAPRPSEE
ncbi:MAG: hemerythrin domain-containing protein [Wenzhouxiangella sp.]